jgi:hypothetical protein
MSASCYEYHKKEGYVILPATMKLEEFLLTSRGAKDNSPVSGSLASLKSPKTSLIEGSFSFRAYRLAITERANFFMDGALHARCGRKSDALSSWYFICGHWWRTPTRRTIVLNVSVMPWLAVDVRRSHDVVKTTLLTTSVVR